jgi:homoserine dehydrogenase
MTIPKKRKRMDNIDLVLLGFGNVGRAFAHLLLEKEEQLRQRYGLAFRVVGIGTGHHGACIDSGGLPLRQAIELMEGGGRLDSLSDGHPPASGPEFIRASAARAMLENTPVNYETGQPALDHIRAALESGMHAITANKGPVVHGYRQLMQLARVHDRKFLFESAVMDGAPVFGMWREGLPAANLRSFRGVLNSTTNLMLSLMQEGRTYPEALSHAQSIGIAETDPSGDTQGWDAAVKAAALVTVLMGVDMRPDQVDREGIEGLRLEDVQAAGAAGERWKLICSGERTDRGARAKVQPERIGPEDPLYNVMGTSSAVTFHSDVLGALTLTETDPGPETTAYGLLADLLNAVRKR